MDFLLVGVVPGCYFLLSCHSRFYFARLASQAAGWVGRELGRLKIRPAYCSGMPATQIPRPADSQSAVATVAGGAAELPSVSVAWGVTGCALSVGWIFRSRSRERAPCVGTQCKEQG